MAFCSINIPKDIKREALPNPPWSIFFVASVVPEQLVVVVAFCFLTVSEASVTPCLASGARADHQHTQVVEVEMG